MQPQANIQFLFKFGERRYMERLLKEGMIHAKPAFGYKQDMPGPRYDKDEGLVHLVKGKDTVFYIKPVGDVEWKTLKVKTFQLKSHLPDKLWHIYSMYTITVKDAKENEFYPFPERMKEFGDTYVFIRNCRAFIERFDRALTNAGLFAHWDMVKYYDPTEDQRELGYFHKKKEHEFEKEFRFIIENPSQSPTELFLGNLEDIAEIEDVNRHKGFQFVWPG